MLLGSYAKATGRRPSPERPWRRHGARAHPGHPDDVGSSRQGDRRAVGSGQKSGPEESGGSAVLDQFGRNLTQFAREGKLDPLVGRDKEVERVMQVCHDAPRTTRS